MIIIKINTFIVLIDTDVDDDVDIYIDINIFNSSLKVRECVYISKHEHEYCKVHMIQIKVSVHLLRKF